MSRFSEEFQDALSAWIKYTMSLMEMQDWRINLVDEPADLGEGSKNTAASITIIYGQKLAELRLSWHFFDTSRERQEHILIHELCHIYADGIDSVVSNGPDVVMGMPAYTIFYENFKVQMEVMVDTFASVLQWFLSDMPIFTGLFDAVMVAELGGPVVDTSPPLEE